VAKTVVNPTAELTPRTSDVPLTLDQLGALSVFAAIKKAPSFSKFPGSYVLRRYQAGEVICSQGQAGWSAFYMLTDEDLNALELASGGSSEAPRRLATARLLSTALKQPATKPFWQRLTGGSSYPKTKKTAPELIPNDGPTDINYESREAAIFSGEVFGEMSCLTRQPRSATVVADSDCYALEILRNVLDQMRKDPQYKEKSEQKYRDRVLEGHLRSLSLFSLLTPEQFRQVVNRVELVEVAPGAVLWDEGDPPTAVYVVRTGMVQVLKSFPWRLGSGDIASWKTLVEKLLGEKENTSSSLAMWWGKLSLGLREALINAGGELSVEIQEQFLTECDELAKSGELVLAKEMADVVAGERYQRDGVKFNAKVKNWTPLQFRRGTRILFHLLLPELIVPPEPVGVQRVLRYLGRGDALGEIGLALNQPRTATCVAYAHSDSTIEATNIELVRVPADLFHDLVEMSPQVKAEVQRIITGRTASDQQSAAAPIHSLSQSSRAEELGILQGQKLMLIDLNRCTRCGDCVEACIDTHDDGHSRLFLDGPRFGDYLIPSSCRNCRDPVCMIGCPVGSIQQGDNGQVVIRDWCIGCGVCARQCPYDSIQMHDESLIPSGAPGWRWIQTAEDPGKHWAIKSFSARHWLPGVSPFEWNIENALEIGSSAVGDFYFRYEFAVDAARLTADRSWRFLATTKGKALELYVNGEPLHLEQDAPQAKRGEFVANLPLGQIGKGSHVLAAKVSAPVPFAAKIFDLRLDLITGEREDTEEKLVTEQAVVCDQCSTLSGKRHACVYACPHEAAMRVDSWVAFPGW
jgi:CRP-like cAMP-binding protein/Fe-S-cluster-containing hydrogenase component 2